MQSQPVTSVDLSTYVRIGRYDLPEPTRTAHPPNNLLAQEASAVTYNWDTDSLFVVGDGGTAVTQVTKTGQLIDTMTLAPGSSPQGTEFYDPEGVTYVGNGKFVLIEERDRQASLFTYVPGAILNRSDVQTVKLGTTTGNIGFEGLSYDPLTGGYIFVKELDPLSVFQTGIDFAAGTATNGSPTATGSTDLFNPALANLEDFSDVFALSNLPSLNGQPDYSHLIILSQESGQIINIDRTGNVFSRLTIVADQGNPLPVAEQTHEGLTMDRDGNLYVVSENGGGDSDHPQLWVFAPSTAPNLPPSAITLTNAVSSLPENTSTSSPVRLATIIVADDGLGRNNLTVSGTDANAFQIIGTSLYLKAGVSLSSITKPTYRVDVNVDDPGAGSAPDATTGYTLTITGSTTGGSASLIISEVAPWSSGNSDASLRVDWFEVTNIGTATANIAGWKVDDDSRNFNNAVNLNGVTTIAPGESVIFLETADLAGKSAAFKALWFGANPPAGLQIGNYSGSGIGLSAGGDQVNLFDSAGTLQLSVAFGTSPAGPFPTFDNAAGLNNATISQLSAVGVNGAFAAANDSSEIGSPGTIGASTLIISEVAPWSSGNSDASLRVDWFEVTNIGASAVDITGWKMDDSSASIGNAVALNGITTIAPGESVIFLETTDLAGKSAAFRTLWFGANPPAGLQIGSYSGAGVGLSTGGDQVNLFDAAGTVQASVTFEASPGGPFPTFDNAVGLNNATISQLSAVGVNGAFAAANDSAEIGSPGTIAGVSLIISEVAPWSSGNSDPSLGVDWFEVTNIGKAAADIVGWKMDDSSKNINNAVALNGITTIAPGESVIFLETSDLAGKSAAFRTLWFGANPPAGLQIGSYSGSGVGLSTGGDQVNLFDAAGTVQASVIFEASPGGPFPTFDNAVGLNNATISQLSAVGVNGAFAAANDSAEIGSPGTIGDGSSTPIVNIQATDADAAETGNNTGTFRITRTGATVGPLIVSYTVATGPGQATAGDYTPTLTGAATIPSGQTFVDITITPVKDNLVEGDETLTLTLGDTGSYDVGPNRTATITIVDALTQTISFAQPANRTYGDAPFMPAATASSGLPVSFAASGNCTVNGAVVTFTGAGSCTIIASQPGNADYSPAPDVMRTFTIARAVTTTAITADLPDPSIVGEQVTVNYLVAAVASGIGTPTGTVTVTDGVDSCSGTVAAGSCVLTLTRAGTRSLQAVYAGDTNFDASTSSVEPHQVRSKVVIDEVYPAFAHPGTRIRLNIIGNGFAPQSRISIEGLGLTILTRYISSTRLTATVIVSADAFRSVRDVTVTNPDGGSATAPAAFVIR
ncbi:MAG: lamin tail domain-containing protein [Blastocatellales bacterium]